MKLLKTSLLFALVLGGFGLFNQAHACSPNLPNYGNCVRQQQQAHQDMIRQGQMQQGQYGQHPVYQEPVDLTPPPALMDKAEVAVAFSPSTGSVGVMSFAWKDSQTHYHFMAGQDTLAKASCIARTQNKNLGKVNLNDADRFIRRHGKKSDCAVVLKNDPFDTNLVALLVGKLPNGKYQLFTATRPSNRQLFSQEQPEFIHLMKKCQAVATSCQIVGQFGDKTELY